MNGQNLSYLLFELAGLAAALLVLFSLGVERTLVTRRFLLLTASLFCGWLLWDLLAVYLGVFIFPKEGNLPFRVAGLPVEEYLFFFFHPMVTWAVVIITEHATDKGVPAR